MKKDKLNIILLSLSILASVVIIFITISMVRAWYTNAIQTGEINAETKELSIKYQLNEGSENVVTYEISNLAFFDPNSGYEGKYLRHMAFKIDIDLENNSSDTVSYEIKFESIKTYTKDEGNNNISIAYAACIFDDVEDDNNDTVDDYFVDKVATAQNPYEITYVYGDTYSAFESSKKSQDTANLVAKEKVTELNPNAYKTRVTLYVFGIQEVDSAANEDFLYTDSTKADTRTYNFTLSIIANPVGSAVVEEIEDENND